MISGVIEPSDYHPEGDYDGACMPIIYKSSLAVFLLKIAGKAFYGGSGMNARIARNTREILLAARDLPYATNLQNDCPVQHFINAIRALLLCVKLTESSQRSAVPSHLHPIKTVPCAMATDLPQRSCVQVTSLSFQLAELVLGSTDCIVHAGLV